MSRAHPPHLSRYAARRQRRSWILVLAGLVAVLGWSGWALARGPITMPGWVKAQVEHRLDRALADVALSASVSDLQFHLRGGRVPVLTAQGLSLSDATGQPHVSLGQVEVIAAPGRLAAGGQLFPVLRLSGLHVNVLRDTEGALTIRLGQQTLAGQIRSPGDLIAQLRRILSAGPLAQVTTLGVEDLSITFANGETGETLATQGGTLRIVRDGADVQANLALGTLLRRDGRPAIGQVRLDLDSAAQTGTQFDLSLRGLIPSGIASIGGRSALSAVLARLQAPVTMGLSASLDDAGALSAFTGQISVGDGLLLLPEASDQPIALDWARGTVQLSASRDRLEVTDLDLSAGPLALAGRAHILVDRSKGLSAPIIVQTVLSHLALDLPQVFEAPVTIDALQADVRIVPDAGQVEIANLGLQLDDTHLTASAHVARGIDGIDWGLDLSAPHISPDMVLANWPLGYSPPTRQWLQTRLLDGDLSNIAVSVRKGAGHPVDLGLSMDFSGAAVAPLGWLPPITDAVGVVQIVDHSLSVGIETGTLTLESGAVLPLQNGLVSLADIRLRNPMLEVGFDVNAPTASALRLLALPGFRGQTVEQAAADTNRPKPLLRPEDATGYVDLRAELAIPLRRTTRMKDIRYDVTGTVRGFTSAALIPGRDLSADSLNLIASPNGLQISGVAMMDAHALSGTFWRSLSREPELRGIAKITASAPLTGALLRDFGVPLPARGATGQGRLQVALDLKPGTAPQLELTGDLQGLGLSVPALSWSKRASTAGTAAVSARLGTGGAFDRIAVSAPGLRLTGSASFAQGGQGLSGLTLSQLEIGQWLRTSAQITLARNGAAGRIRIDGGTLDLRTRPKGGGGNSGNGPRLDIALDRIVLNDGISLNAVNGALSPQGEGQLSGQVNGGPRATIDIARTSNGASYRVRAQDAGAVIRAAGLLQQADGGALDLRLVPTGGTGNFRGSLRVTDTTLRNAPAMAEMLSALSVVGAIEQAAGAGIPFSDVRAAFRLTPGALIVDSASAVGASIGLSLDGRVDLSNRRMALQGVVSPIYFLNQAGSFMTRRGEGLLGMTFRIDGALDAPRVSANPLSLLAPGFLRELFRNPTPGSAEDGQ